MNSTQKHCLLSSGKVLKVLLVQASPDRSTLYYKSSNSSNSGNVDSHSVEIRSEKIQLSGKNWTLQSKDWAVLRGD